MGCSDLHESLSNLDREQAARLSGCRFQLHMPGIAAHCSVVSLTNPDMLPRAG